jgi:CubicO group peptidase (beta-lactamase class C family)
MFNILNKERTNMRKKALLGLNALLLAGCSAASSTPTVSMALPENTAIMESTDLESKLDEVWNTTFNDAYENGNEGMGAVVLAVKDGEIIVNKAYGWAQYYEKEEGSSYADPTYVKMENPVEMSTDTLFDLASITKTLATTQAVMMLVDQGKLDVNDTVASYLPGFEANGKGGITIAQLLTHSSGLPQWEPTYLYVDNKEDQLEYIKNLELNPDFATDGSEPKYSDFSFMTLGYVVEAITGQDLDVYVKENIYEPLGMTTTGYLPLENGFDVSQIAATSLGNPYEYRMVDEEEYPDFGYDCTDDAQAFEAFDGWRQTVLIGEVNDGNAGMATGGVAGHAGLYSNASDLAILLQCMNNGGTYNGVTLYDSSVLDDFTAKHTSYAENHDGALSEEFGYAFKLDQSWMGESATENCYGHDGFTGTTYFIDPDNDYIFICLSNKMQAGFTEEGSGKYYNTNAWLSWNMNQAVKDVLEI